MQNRFSIKNLLMLHRQPKVLILTAWTIFELMYSSSVCKVLVREVKRSRRARKEHACWRALPQACPHPCSEGSTDPRCCSSLESLKRPTPAMSSETAIQTSLVPSRQPRALSFLSLDGVALSDADLAGCRNKVVHPTAQCLAP